MPSEQKSEPQKRALDYFKTLAQELREAEGPSRRLDNNLWLVFGKGPTEPPFPDYENKPLNPQIVSCGRTMREAMEQFPNDVSGIARSWNVPRLTEDASAALDILMPGVDFNCGRYDGDTYWAGVGSQYHPEEAANIALAICLAHVEFMITALTENP